MLGTNSSKGTWDVAVIGGGLAGLTAAAKLARGGLRVGLFEQSKHLGGRAMTQVEKDIHFNLGAHALYVRGHAAATLKEIGVSFTGKHPSAATGLVLFQGELYPLPGSLRALLTSRFLGMREKWRLARLLGSLPSIDPKPLMTTPVSEWLKHVAGQGALAKLLGGLIRLSTYGNDPDYQSAGTAIEQVQLAFGGNVWYLDGGWQTLVNGLRQIATDFGAEIETGRRVTSLTKNGGQVDVRFADGRTQTVAAAVIATLPEAACEILSDSVTAGLRHWMERRRPAQAACLDVALSRSPDPSGKFALGLDQPLYYSMHSAVARLAPDGVTVLHLMKYFRPEASESPQQVQAELEGLLDKVQPGWRSLVLRQRFLPNMCVAASVPRADEGGLAGRPAIDEMGEQNIFLAGDWVGGEGQLADAAVASASAVANRLLQLHSKRRQTLADRETLSKGRVSDVSVSR
ncbi:MAG: FAD-dependent oxidoreductase [Planctomycetota bacterium]